MNANAITAKIIEEARAQAVETLREAGERASQMRMDAENEAAKKHEAGLKQADKQAAEMRERMLRTAELDQKKALLEVKRDVLDKVFEAALVRMRQMPDAQKKAYLTKLLVSATEQGEELVPDAAERALYDASFMAELNAAIKKENKPPITLSGESRDLGGGFVLKRGGLEINCTFVSVLAELRPTLEADVAAALFAQN